MLLFKKKIKVKSYGPTYGGYTRIVTVNGLYPNYWQKSQL